MEPGVEIRKIHDAAQRYNQQLRLEGLILLQYAVMALGWDHSGRVVRGTLLRNAATRKWPASLPPHPPAALNSLRLLSVNFSCDQPPRTAMPASVGAVL